MRDDVPNNHNHRHDHRHNDNNNDNDNENDSNREAVATPLQKKCKRTPLFTPAPTLLETKYLVLVREPFLAEVKGIRTGRNRSTPNYQKRNTPD